MDNQALAEKCYRVANRLAKWRMVFTGWQLGTRDMNDSEAQAVRDHREVTILLRAEVNALTKVLIDAGVTDHEKWTETLIEEMEHLDKEYEQKFPGFTSRDDGMSIDVQKAGQTMKGWKP